VRHDKPKLKGPTTVVDGEIKIGSIRIRTGFGHPNTQTFEDINDGDIFIQLDGGATLWFRKNSSWKKVK
jgi:hypothetical protein